MEENLPKISYLFGAGSSAQKLPTIKGLPTRILLVRNFIEENYTYEDDDTTTIKDFTYKKADAKNYILLGLEKLYEASSNHSTIDTYAKKLYLNGSNNQEVNELTFFLALYFNIEQKLSGIDPRYNSFLISILDSSVYSFPDNLKFLSWNYDLQFELAYSNLLDRRITELDFGHFNINERYWDKNKFTSIKINGSCAFSGRFDDSFPLIENIRSQEPKGDDLNFALNFAMTHLKRNMRVFDGHVKIDFAWYKKADFVNRIAELYNETQVLVVVGYSFPFFNREIDRKIIRGMENLKKIYIQDLSPNDIQSRFLSILPNYKKRDIEIITVDTVDEFFLPPEL